MKSFFFSNKLLNYLNILLTVFGYFYYKIFKYTPSIFYQSFVRSYCFTNGKIINLLCNFETFNLGTLKLNKNATFKEKTNNLNLYKEEANIVLKNLENCGYHVFKQRLNSEIVTELINFAKSKECIVYSDNGKKILKKYAENDVKISSKYTIKEQDLIENTTIQKLVNNEIFYIIAQKYFKTRPCLSAVNMWWSPVRKKKINIEIEKNNKSAQMYHFDLDRIKWLKLFIYLTDIDEESGPHEYVETSHKVNSKPKELLDYGYKRIPDNLINKYYKKNLIKKVYGKKGTMFIADTSCYHRGKPPTNNDRLLMVIEFSNSLFGAEYNKIKVSENSEILNCSKLSLKEKIIIS